MVQAGNGNSGLLSVLSTGLGNFSASYNFGSISVALLVMSSTVCTNSQTDCNEGLQASWVFSTLSAIVFAGAICGQLSMGYVGDVLGRGRALGASLAIATVAAFFSSVVSLGTPVSIYIVIALFRFLLGVGVGGVYPLSASKAAEDSGSTATGKVNITGAGWAFLWQIPGGMLPWTLAWLFSYSDSMTQESKWRLILGLGAIPAALVCCLTGYEDYLTEKAKVVTAAEASVDSNISTINPVIVYLAPVTTSSSSFTDNTQPNNQDLIEPSFLNSEAQSVVSTTPRSAESTSDAVRVALGMTSYRRKLLVTGGCWFIFDVCVYGVYLFSGEIISALLPPADDVSSNQHIRIIAEFSLLASAISSPATIITILLLKHISTKTMQMIGFFMIGVSFLVLAIVFYPLRGKSDLGVYSCYVFLNICLSGGACVTTFCLSAEVYPKEVRSTFNGISAAIGKSGAIVGSFFFGLLAEQTSYPTVMVICAVLCGVAVLMTYYFLDSSVDEGTIGKDFEGSRSSVGSRVTEL